MRSFSLFLLLVSTLMYGPRSARANCEHAHFHGPSPIQGLVELDVLKGHVQTLTPMTRSLKMNLESQFPLPDGPSGLATWLLLDELTLGQRYEARACYSAIQPTNIRLDTFELQTVHDESTGLLSSLVQYVTRHQPGLDASVLTSVLKREFKAQLGANSTADLPTEKDRESRLLLRITSYADYYTDHRELMIRVPPTYTEIILDPWMFGLIPSTVVPILGYISVVIAISYPLGRAIALSIESISRCGDLREKKV